MFFLKLDDYKGVALCNTDKGACAFKRGVPLSGMIG